MWSNGNPLSRGRGNGHVEKGIVLWKDKGLVVSRFCIKSKTWKMGIAEELHGIVEKLFVLLHFEALI